MFPLCLHVCLHLPPTILKDASKANEVNWSEGVCVRVSASFNYLALTSWPLVDTCCIVYEHYHLFLISNRALKVFLFNSNILHQRVRSSWIGCQPNQLIELCMQFCSHAWLWGSLCCQRQAASHLPCRATGTASTWILVGLFHPSWSHASQSTSVTPCERRKETP